ncbi:TAXI family TRAP transporter solute-binding subunit [Ignatzschineria rhizosphaerae]|uniref:TAXI family TRAP transporter solute-binding subunit n=1 Tax=Ignatzschineria rhizosphaerae TaxID=2923279 RepID=A0ABY3X1S1_9GAMM|nr:TAXI family TRAP transporter solute-binding subunit [Ignatzschineria rhizosphaerae]UNM95830.1 TAXI family TRAP transporter solute-binding subunit [Ignatzschineria rhizosphaerae]
MKKTFGLKKLLMVSALSALLVACEDDNNTDKNDTNASVSADQLETRFVTIATGGSSGPYNIIGTTLGQIYSKTYGVNSKSQSTGASIQNVNLVNQGKAEMALTMSDVLSQAVEGTGSFPEKIENVVQVAALYPNYVQIVTSKKSGIKTMDDLKGKRVAVGDLNSGTEMNARALLNGHGITYDDLRIDYLGFAEAVDALRGGKIDAAVLTSGLPNASIMELEQGFDLQLVEIRKPMVDEIAQDQSYFLSAEIPAGTYNNEEAVPTAIIVNALVVRKDLSEDDVYKLTKTFFENLDNLSNAHQAAKGISLENAQKGLVAPLHPGAKKYYDEQAAK